jgi:uncharacterized protein (TIGR02231 family)
MKIFILATAALFFSSASAQQKDTIVTYAALTHATVYYGYGAELQHATKATLVNGLQQVVINGLALQPDINTFQIACPENVTILSYYHRIFTPQTKMETLPSKSADTLRLLQKQVAAINNDYTINEDLLRRLTLLIENNFATQQKKELSSAELIKLTAYYTENVKTLKERSYALQLKKADINEKIDAITTRLNAANALTGEEPAAKPIGQLILQVMAKGGGAADIDITYFTRNAGWIPAYEIRMKTLDNSLKLVYKASVTQNTGLDWKNIRLSLSTSNPNQNSILPVLTPAFLQLYVPVLYNSMIQADANKASSAGTLEEVVITAYTKDNKRNYTASQANISSYTTLRESQLNTNFDIDLPYDIPADGKSYSVVIKDEKVPATYKHFAIPKLDPDAFLTAQLNSWDSLSLLPGEANIIMDNVYLGKSFLDPNTTTDTLSLSLGRDKRIAVNRVLVKEFTTTTVKGENKTELFTYEITVRNNKKQPVDLLLKDQYPVSKEKDVVITLNADGNASVDKETGMLSWQVKLQPGESRKIRFSYTIKYPKDKKLQETR